MTVVEREVKLAAPATGPLPTLSDPLAGVVAEPAGTRQLLACYFDTDDLRLTRAGASLRHRDDEGWAVKLPKGVAGSGRLDRATYAFAGEPGAPPADAIDLVQAWTRRAAVGPVARLRTTRRTVRLRTTAGQPIGEVVDDDVTVLGERTSVRGFRELEFELVDDAPAAQVAAIVARLRAAGAGPPDPTPKIVRALAPEAAGPPDVNPPGERPATAAGVVRAALGVDLARLITHDPGVRRGDEDPEDVHQARVATRRLRSHLRSFSPLLDAPTDELRAELGWLGDVFGRVRDADVLLERLQAEVAELPVEDRGPASRLLHRLRTQRAQAREELLAALRSDRYGTLLDSLVDVARVADLGTRTAEPDSDDGDREVLREVIRPAWASLRRAVEQCSDPPSDAELHSLRRHAKRLRYATEAVEPVFGKPARDFARGDPAPDGARRASGFGGRGPVAAGRGDPRPRRAGGVRRRAAHGHGARPGPRGPGRVRGRVARDPPQALAPLVVSGSKPKPEPPVTEVRAAGGVVVRRVRRGWRTGPEVALVHRPRYDDWSFPKGKLDRDETDEEAAYREVLEETGLSCRLHDDLGEIRYEDRRGRPKVVHYWLMEPEPDHGSGFVANAEVDELRWLEPDDAAKLLSYQHDRDLLERLHLPRRGTRR